MARNPNTAGTRPLAPAGEKRRGINPLFAGIIIGLLLGVGMALGLAIWLNRANNPFVEKARPVEALPTVPAKPATAPGATAAAKTDIDKPRFDFYQILPGEKSGKSESAPAAARPVAEPSAAAKPAAEPAVKPTPAQKLEIKPASTEIFLLQAGAFQNQTDAENMRGKVAFAGFEAAVRTVNLPDRGTLYRVRLGPYRSLDEVNRIKGVLSQNGIDAAIVKGSD